MRGVVVSGNLVLDILVRPVDRMEWGATTLVAEIEQRLGGNAASTSFALAKLGVPVRVLGPVGADAFGDFLAEKLRGAGVDTGGVRRTSGGTSATVVLVNRESERLFLHRYGASGETEFTAEELRRAFAGGAAHYHLASPFGLARARPHLAEMLRLAREAGLETSVDTHWDAAGRWLADLAPCLPHTGILFANRDEARMLTGRASEEAAAEALLGLGASAVVVKLGAEGCAVFRPEGGFRCPGFQVEAVDGTGAGDCFVGGFLAALDRGCSWERAARVANAAGALSAGRLGAVEGLLSWEETEQWMAARG